MREGRRLSVLAVAAPIAAALLLTLPFATRKPLWLDEVDSVDAASRTWSGLAHLLSHQDAPLGLYYGLLHVWISVAGASALAVRLPSVFGVVVGVALVADTARVLGGRRAAVIAGLMLATSPLVTTYALDARPYALELACAAGLVRLLVTAGEQPGRGRRAAYAGLLVLGAGLHLFLLLAVPAHLIAMRVTHRPVRPWLVPALTASLFLMPLLLLASHQTGEVGYLHRPGALNVLGWLQAMGGGKPWEAIPLLVLGGLVARHVPPRGRVLALMVLLLPGAVLLTVSFLHPLFLNRYVLASCVGFSLLVGVGAAKGRRWHRHAAAGLLFVSAVTAVTAQLRPFRYEDLRAGSDIVLDASRHGSSIVYASTNVRTAVAYYLLRLDHGRTLPRDVLLDPTRDEVKTGNFGGADIPAPQAAVAVRGRTQVWRLSFGSASSPRRTDTGVLGLLSRHYIVTRRVHFGQLLVEEYNRRSGPR